MAEKQSCRHHQRDLSAKTARGKLARPHREQTRPDALAATSQSKTIAANTPDFGRQAGNYKSNYLCSSLYTSLILLWQYGWLYQVTNDLFILSLQLYLPSLYQGNQGNICRYERSILQRH